ncbi:hypothetical protein THOM_3139 [Trachipleistophora hominis]|uniref:Uncharacterized protein n=1 Tax=Trachipleistophora hominis TaxID=72359 RepID=L7JR44_TRAHO|nr:hypothetical protein THOM_3139 [Trachipleistophora hominis]
MALDEVLKDFFTNVYGWISIIFILIVILMIVYIVKALVDDSDNRPRDSQGNVIVVNQQMANMQQEKSKREEREREKKEKEEK